MSSNRQQQNQPIHMPQALSPSLAWIRAPRHSFPYTWPTLISSLTTKLIWLMKEGRRNQVPFSTDAHFSHSRHLFHAKCPPSLSFSFTRKECHDNTCTMLAPLDPKWLESKWYSWWFNCLKKHPTTNLIPFGIDHYRKNMKPIHAHTLSWSSSIGWQRGTPSYYSWEVKMKKISSCVEVKNSLPLVVLLLSTNVFLGYFTTFFQMLHYPLLHFLTRSMSSQA